jgi:hypothetical protein
MLYRWVFIVSRATRRHELALLAKADNGTALRAHEIARTCALVILLGERRVLTRLPAPRLLKFQSTLSLHVAHIRRVSGGTKPPARPGAGQVPGCVPPQLVLAGPARGTS